MQEKEKIVKEVVKQESAVTALQAIARAPSQVRSEQQGAAVCSSVQHAIGNGSKFSAQEGKESGDSGVLAPCRKLKWNPTCHPPSQTG